MGALVQASRACDKHCPVIAATQGLEEDSTARGSYVKMGVGERMNGALGLMVRATHHSSDP